MIRLGTAMTDRRNRTEEYRKQQKALQVLEEGSPVESLRVTYVAVCVVRFTFESERFVMGAKKFVVLFR